MDPTSIPKNQSAETVSGRPQNKPGIYKHRDTGATFITAAGEEGILQADALLSPVWKDAWERVGDAPSSQELLEMRKKQLIKDTKAEKARQEAEKAELETATAEAESVEGPSEVRETEEAEAPKPKSKK